MSNSESDLQSVNNAQTVIPQIPNVANIPNIPISGTQKVESESTPDRTPTKTEIPGQGFNW